MGHAPWQTWLIKLWEGNSSRKGTELWSRVWLFCRSSLSLLATVFNQALSVLG